MSSITNKVESALMGKCVIENPFYRREGVLLPAGESRGVFLYYAGGRPRVTGCDLEDLEKDEGSDSRHFHIGYEALSHTPVGVKSLLARFVLLSYGVRGPDTTTQISDDPLSEIRVYDRRTGKLLFG